ncbi:MAG TPA: hypothetical protein PKC21_03360 [Oligoflexia bacterium]|nr:hypothetical protein [Oligoflexia bacterium]HMR24373.1 hypothetical protein [Oligoflexia bacterium]
MRNKITALIISLLVTISTGVAGPNDLELQTSVCFGDPTNSVIDGEDAGSEQWDILSENLQSLFGNKAFNRPERGYQFFYNFSSSSYDLDKYGVYVKLKAADIGGDNYRIKSTVKLSGVDQALLLRVEQLASGYVSTLITSEFNLDNTLLSHLSSLGHRRLRDPMPQNLSTVMNYEVAVENVRSRTSKSVFSKDNIHSLFQYGKGRSLQNCPDEESCVLSAAQSNILNSTALIRNIPMRPVTLGVFADAVQGTKEIIQVGQLKYKKQVWRIGPLEEDWVNATNYNQAIKDNFMNDKAFEVHLEQWINVDSFSQEKSIFEISLKAKNFKQRQEIQKLGQYFFSSLAQVEIQQCDASIRNRDFALGKLGNEQFAQRR